MNLLQSEVIDAPIASVEVALQGFRESSQAIPEPVGVHSCRPAQLYPPDVPAEREDAITWARFDDNYDSNPKIRMAGRDGKNLHEVSIRWSCRLRTDGHIPKAVLPELGILAQLPGNKPLQRRAAERLVELNLWEDLGDGWHIHDFAEYAPPQKWRSELPQYGARSSELYRKENDGLRQEIKNRSGGHCYICGVEVDWLDRRSGRGATYEHVNPDGPNSFENLAVACRSCNVRKGKTTDKVLWQNRKKTEPIYSEQNPQPNPSRPVVSLEELQERVIHRGVAPDTVDNRLVELRQLAEGKGAVHWIPYVLTGFQGQACLFDQAMSRWLQEDHEARKKEEQDAPAVFSLPKLRRME